MSVRFAKILEFVSQCRHCNNCNRILFVSILSFLRGTQIKKKHQRRKKNMTIPDQLFISLGKNLPKKKTSSFSVLYFRSVPQQKSSTQYMGIK